MERLKCSTWNISMVCHAGVLRMALRFSFKAPSPRESVNRTIGVVGFMGNNPTNFPQIDRFMAAAIIN